jgi:AAA family ATP:ADP antiporter
MQTMMFGRIRLPILLATFYYFLVIAAFWVLKPLRVSLVVQAYGPEVYPVLKQSSVLLVPLIFVSYRRLTKTFSEKTLTPAISGFFALTAALFGVIFNLGFQDPWLMVLFYYLIEVYSAVVITHFWIHLTRGGAHLKSHVGVITMGGLLGGITASGATGWFTEELGFGVLGLFSGLVLLSLLVHGLQRRFAPLEMPIAAAPAPIPAPPNEVSSVSPTAAAAATASLALFGGTAAIFAIYEVVSTVLDAVYVFQLRHQVVERSLMAAYQGKVAFVGQILALTIQFLFISTFRTEKGLRFGLYVLPLCLLAGSLGYAFYPDLSVIAITVSADIALSNSLFLSSRESLFQRMSEKLRLQLESFNEIVVRRTGKVAGALLVVYLSLDSTTLSMVNILAIVMWLAAVGVVLASVRDALRRPEGSV